MFFALGQRFRLRDGPPSGGRIFVEDDHGHDQLCFAISLALQVRPVYLALNLCEKFKFNAIEDLGISYRDNDPELTNEVGVCSVTGDVDLSLRDFREYVLAYLRAAIPHRFEDPEWLHSRLPDPVLAVLRGEAPLRC